MGQKPATMGTAKYATVTNVEWSGELDANGCFKTYAISNSDYIAAKQDAWATGEVLTASEAALIDKAIMGSDYTSSINRLQMAAFLYRALQWVKNNSDTEYTVYESKLGAYTDAGQLAGWAKEPMAFMNALGLINGTSATKLSPNGTCTIEQAIAVASRSLYADRTGWSTAPGCGYIAKTARPVTRIPTASIWQGSLSTKVSAPSRTGDRQKAPYVGK